MDCSKELKLKRLANNVRMGVIEGVYNAGCGHPGGLSPLQTCSRTSTLRK